MTVKKICVLQITPHTPSPEHIKLFSDKENSDFYFVTHDKAHPDALKFCPNTKWAETRNILAELVPKKYDYYAFVDYDYVLRPQRELGPLEQILEDLEEFNPAVMTYYPGKGLNTPYATDTVYRESRDASCLPFAHAGFKIIHRDLMRWFFPLTVRFGGGSEACHLFNILEIPFLKNAVCSHKMIYDNGVTDDDSPHNQDGAWNKYRMDDMWRWIRPAFKKTTLIDKFVTPNLVMANLMHQYTEHDDSELVKRVFVELFRTNSIAPEKALKDKKYWDLDKISNFFDLSHPRFLNLSLPFEERTKTIEEETKSLIEDYLKQLTFKDFNKLDNPWFDIVKTINSKIIANRDREVSIDECIDIYQKIEANENPSLFHHSCKIDTSLVEFLKDKRVAFVGPAPYLSGLKKGDLIDSYDVVVRIQHTINSEEDCGSRTDIVQSCLNSNYGPPLVQHLQNLKKELRPKFILCNDQPSALKPNGTWALVDEIYDDVFKELEIPFVHLKNIDNTWDRWALYWQIYPKAHIENFGNRTYVKHTANFNSGYGALNYLLRYPLKELAVFGMDFYKTALPQTNEEKYNAEYIKTYGDERSHLGPSSLLHDQISQMTHCKNVLFQDERFNLDSPVIDLLNADNLNIRIKRFKMLPKFKHEIRP
tara:strand:- start:1193 stop:3142 length:1950 start_codon:yes stop_codon:yes gene_type:complete